MKDAYRLSSTQTTLHVQIEQLDKFDLSVFALENIDLFLDCAKQNQSQGFVEYEKGDWISLDYFLRHSHFSKLEACCFLASLFHCLGQALKNQPVILDVQAIFLSSKGDEWRLCRAPLIFEAWMKRQEDIEWFLNSLLYLFPSDALDLLGLLWKGSTGKERFENLAPILERLYQESFKKSLFRKRKSIPPYCAKKPIFLPEDSSSHSHQNSSYFENSMIQSSQSIEFIKDWENTLPQSAIELFKQESQNPTPKDFFPFSLSDSTSSKVQDKSTSSLAILEKAAVVEKSEDQDLPFFQERIKAEEARPSEENLPWIEKEKADSSSFQEFHPSLENATVVLEQYVTPCSLEIQGKQHVLCGPEVFVGRAKGCHIQLKESSVSSMHAKLTCQEERWYLQDLKSTNCTWLNEKRVIRKMRLKEGMVIRFGQCEAIFHQSVLQT